MVLKVRNAVAPRVTTKNNTMVFHVLEKKRKYALISM
jgi:hypothetical protein